MPTNPAPSPRIAEITWGRMTVEGIGTGKDFKLWPGGGRSWDWSETGTSHQPGIQAADAEELIEHGATTIVLSQGMLLALGTPEKTVQALERRGIRVYRAETSDAAQIYNELAEAGEAVGGLFHSTC